MVKMNGKLRRRWNPYSFLISLDFDSETKLESFCNAGYTQDSIAGGERRRSGAR